MNLIKLIMRAVFDNSIYLFPSLYNSYLIHNKKGHSIMNVPLPFLQVLSYTSLTLHLILHFVAPSQSSS